MVKRLIRHWTLFSMSNSTELDPELEETVADEAEWREFLANNSEFIRPLDFVRDMAVEDPGDSPVLSAQYGQLVMKENTTNFLPFFGTDIGLCTLVKPQLSFNEVSLQRYPTRKESKILARF